MTLPTHIENYFASVDQKLPKSDLLSGKDLVKAGIVKSESTLARWRSHGYGPAFLKMTPGQVRYVRTSVMEWLRNTSQPMFAFMYPTKTTSPEVSA